MTGAGIVTCFPLLLARAQRCYCRWMLRHSSYVLPPEGVTYNQHNSMRTSTTSVGCHKLLLPPAGVTVTRTFACSVVCLKKTNVFDGGAPTGGDTEEDDAIDDHEVEELFQEVQFPAAAAVGQQKVFIVQPDVKWSRRKQQQTTGRKDRCTTDRQTNKQTNKLVFVLQQS